MSEEWSGGDPFVDAEDPDATEREQRRRERDERRRQREEKDEAKNVPAPPPPPEPPPPRTPEAEFWDEEPAADPLPPPPEPSRSSSKGFDGKGPLRRHPLRTGFVLLAVLLLVAGAAAVIYRHHHREAPPPVVLKTITATIPEGLSRAQAEPIAKEAGLKGSYLKASVKSKFLNPASYGGKGSKNLEGFLFPDTFELEAHAPASDLVQLQLQDFKRRIKGVNMSYARSKNLTVYDVVTIASMIEREAMLESERPLIAAVIYNRLHEGIPLGIDATTRFATGNYTEPLTESELANESPYNTRVNSGLPPGPIGSPGLASIEAAARPAKVNYLYYVVKPGTCGEHSFSSTEAQFEADVARYNEAREAAGGESPDSCGE